MKRFTLLLFLAITVSSHAQNTRLEVPIIAQDLPEGMGRVLVYSLPDSSLEKGNYIDSNLFSIRFNAKIGETFYLKVMAPGFNDTLINFTVNDTLIRIEPLILMSDLTFDAVNVVYKKPVFERTMNGLSVNVKGTTLEELNTLFDILKASPRLSSPDDENIEIIGRGVPLILIDRQAILSNDELRAIPASEVDRIEIITNPSSKYRAQGSGNGVIEVYTNNFSLQGYRAHIRANGGLNTQSKFESGLNAGLNIKKGKFSLNGNGGMHLGQGYNYGISSFSTLDSSLYSNSEFTGENDYRWQYYTLKMGYDFNESQRLSFGVGGHGNKRQNDQNSSANYFSNGILTTERLGNSQNESKWQNNRAFVNYTWDTDTLGSALELNLNYTRRVSDNQNVFATDFYDYQNQSSSEYDALATSQDRPNVGEFRVNYEYYIDSQFILEVGGDVSLLLNEKRFNRYNAIGGDWVEDTIFTNSYDYQERIAGVFAQISKKWKKFGFQLGVRGEYTDLDGFSRSLDQQFMDSSFLLPFPNAGMLFEPNEKVGITVYYSSGIDRPSFSNYDPFVRILDSLNVQVGNPYLRPSYNHTVGLELDLFYSYNLSMSYSRYNNMASSATFIDPQSYVSTTTPWNSAYSETYSLSLSVPIKLEWLDGWNSFWMDYNNYVFTDVFQRDPFQNITMGFYSYLTFSLPYDLKLMNRFSLSKWGNDEMTGRINRNWGLRLTKEFDRPDLNIFFEVNDIFPNKNISNSVNGNFLSYSESQWRFTGFRLGIFFKFGRLTANTNIKESNSGQSDRF